MQTAIETPEIKPAPESVESKPPAPEEILANKNAEFKKIFDDRVAELKAYGGKTFVRRDGASKSTFKILKYEGVGTVCNGQRAHLFRVESSAQFIWTPVASEFLKDFVEVEVPATVKTPEII